MFNGIIRLALAYRGPVLILAIIVLVLGGMATARLPIDVFPDLDRPRVVLLTEAPGLSPEEAEASISQPVETAILGAPGVEAVRSQAAQGIVVTYVEFGWKIDVRHARQTVQERLTSMSGQLPAGVRPQMTPPSSIMGQIMHLGIYRRTGPFGGDLAPISKARWLVERITVDGKVELRAWNVVDRNDPGTWQAIQIERWHWTGKSTGQTADVRIDGRDHIATFRTPDEARMDLRTLADWVIRPRLLKEKGVAEVIVLGGDRKQYQVLIRPERLLKLGVTIQDVDRAIQDNNLNTSGGHTEEGHVERPIRVIGRLGPEPAKVLEDLRQVPVKMVEGRSIQLGQVADIVEGPAPKRGDGGVDGHDAVVITIVKQPHADTRMITDRVKQAMADMEPSLPADVAVNTELFQLKNFIDRGVYYVAEALAIGAGLVVIVLLLFLLNVRSTIITLTAIPLSLVVTTLVFRLVGWISGTELSINVMTLGGIAVAMGELVDDAIVDVENIWRRLRENAALAVPLPKLQVVLAASREVRSAVVFGTAVVVLAFLPLFALSGIEGRLFVPLGIAYIVSILASLLVSLTVTPVLASYLLSVRGGPASHGDGLLLRLLKATARPMIRLSMRQAPVLLALTWLAVGYCGWRLTTIGSDFLPRFDEGSIQLNVTLPAGSSLKASNDAARLIDRKLRSMQYGPDSPDGLILHSTRRTGRAELDEHAEPVNRSEYILAMRPSTGRRRDELLETLLRELRDEVPGVDLEAEQPLAHLISHMLSGVQAEIAIKVFGDDLNQLQTVAQQIKTTIADVPGVTPPIIDPQEVVDELHIILRPEDLADHGLSRAYVARFVEVALKGEVVSQVLEGQRRFDLVVKLDAPDRTDYLQLGELRIDRPDGKGQVRLKEVADLPPAAGGPNQVNRENLRRRAVIRCNTQGRDLGTVVAEVQARVRSKVALPEGYFVEFSGQFEAQRSATTQIALLAGVAILGMFGVLYLLFPSTRITLQVLNAVPTALIGGAMALVVTGQTLTVASLVGFVSLGGIAVRNGVLLMTHYVHLMRSEGESFSMTMIERGSLERLAPVLMTALTAGIALVPLVVGGEKPGLEVLYPVSTVILGGLITSTFCEFLIHPGLFWRFSGSSAARIANEPSSQARLAAD